MTNKLATATRSEAQPPSNAAARPKLFALVPVPVHLPKANPLAADPLAANLCEPALHRGAERAAELAAAEQTRRAQTAAQARDAARYQLD